MLYSYINGGNITYVNFFVHVAKTHCYYFPFEIKVHLPPSVLFLCYNIHRNSRLYHRALCSLRTQEKPSGSKQKQTNEHSLNNSGEITGACSRRTDIQTADVYPPSSGKFPAERS